MAAGERPLPGSRPGAAATGGMSSRRKTKAGGGYAGTWQGKIPRTSEKTTS